MATETHDFSSTMIASATYDPDNGSLDVTMHHGRDYTVSGVTADEWDRFKSAQSPGGFWHAVLKGRG